MEQNIKAKVPKIIYSDAIGTASKGFLFSDQTTGKGPFAVKRAFSADALLLCLASMDYIQKVFIRNYEEFRSICLASG